MINRYDEQLATGWDGLSFFAINRYTEQLTTGWDGLSFWPWISGMSIESFDTWTRGDAMHLINATATLAFMTGRWGA